MPSDQINDAKRVFIYARVSSDLQSAASIDDQLRICAEWAAKQGLLVAGNYTDQAISGASPDPARHSEVAARRCRR